MRSSFSAGVSTCVSALFILLAGGSTARAQSAESRATSTSVSVGADLTRARELVTYADYNEAARVLSEILRAPRLGAAEHVQALELLAIVHIARRNQEAARETLATLYSRDPGHRLTDPDASPSVRTAFDRAASRSPTPVSVTIENRTAAAAPSRNDAILSLALRGAVDAVHEVRIYSRAADQNDYASSVVPLDAEGRAEFRVGVPSTGAAVDVRYHFEATAPSGHVLARTMSSEAPGLLRVPPPPTPPPSEANHAEAQTRTDAPSLGNDSRVEESITPQRNATPRESERESGSILTRWWFWTAVGAVVVGGAVTGYVLLGPPSEGPPDGDLGTGALQ